MSSEMRNQRRCECGVQEGELHDYPCRWELCPFCKCVFNEGCGCCYDYLGLRSSENRPEREWLSQKVYEEGLSEEQNAEWHAIIASRGRFPFVDAPLMCGRCGKLWPDLFVVQDKAWEYYTGPLLRDAMLCEKCFHELREAIDKHQPRPEWVPTEVDIIAYLTAWRMGDRDTMQRLDPCKFNPGYRPPRR